MSTCGREPKLSGTRQRRILLLGFIALLFLIVGLLFKADSNSGTHSAICLQTAKNWLNRPVIQSGWVNSASSYATPMSVLSPPCGGGGPYGVQNLLLEGGTRLLVDLPSGATDLVAGSLVHHAIQWVQSHSRDRSHDLLALMNFSNSMLASGNQQKSLFWPVMVCIAAEALLILTLLVQWVRRRSIEAALREDQEQLAKTEDLALVMTTHVGLDGRWLKVPPTLCELLGYSEKDLLGAHFRDVTHPDDFEADWTQCQRLIRGEVKSFALEKRYIHRDGAIIWVYLNCSIVTDEKGKPAQFLTFIKDISDRKRLEQSLRLSEERFSKAFRSNPDAFAIVRQTDGSHLDVNHSWEKFFGYSRSEALGKSSLELGLFLHPEDRTQLHTMVRANGSASDFEAEMNHKSGLVRIGSISMQPTSIGNETCLLVTVRDLTERRRIEHALAEGHRRYALATTAGRVGVWDWNLETNEIYVDPQLKALLGYRDDEIRNHLDDWGSHVHPEDRQAVSDATKAYLNGLTSSFEVEHRMLGKDGTVCWFLARGNLFGGEGRIRRMVGTDTDITERKRAEDALRRSGELNRAVLASFHHHIAVLDRNGGIIAVNDAWNRFASQNGAKTLSAVGPGINYLEICRVAGSRDTQAGIRSVLNGVRDVYSEEYSCPYPSGEPRWFEISVVPLKSKEGGAIVSHFDISERRQAEGQLLQIAKGVSAAIGENFFVSLVRYLSEALGADYAFVAELTGDSKERVRTVAAWAGGKIIENLEYALAGTPCANVVSGIGCSYPNGVQQTFPRDLMLAEMGVEAYVGRPLLDSADRPTGLVAVLYRQPVRDCTRAESMLQIFGARAAAEIERRETERLMSQSCREIHNLAGRLITAQEVERTRIARDLHDDLSQQVAGLAIGLGSLERQLPVGSGVVGSQIEKLEDRTFRIAESIRRISHELHCTTLEHVGLVQALQLHCSQLKEREKIEITFEVQDGLTAIPADVAKCLYRVAQESLRNIVRHSMAKQAKLALTGTSQGLRLRVVDQGVGFDLEQPQANWGLGLVSMRERVRMVNGSFELKSRPGTGTELIVHIPLGSVLSVEGNSEKAKSAAG